jgi:hypothetical protein
LNMRDKMTFAFRKNSGIFSSQTDFE